MNVAAVKARNTFTTFVLLGGLTALADALETLQRGAEAIPMGINPSAAPMYVVNPLAALHGRGMSNLFSTHPPMEERISRLRTLRVTPAPARPSAAMSY